jgi:quercetin dioxygenase-like cupin family protein
MMPEVASRRIDRDAAEVRRFDNDEHIKPYTEARLLNRDPDMVEVTFPPGGRLDRHSHPSDTVYVFRKGQFTIEGEGSYEAGDIRVVKAGDIYGPEYAGPDGAVLLIIAANGSFGTDWDQASIA